ncbi:MAG: hypothetical protein LBI73_03540 [Myroides sp.]|nr:hypothetical protein [Myroides sp.]
MENRKVISFFLRSNDEEVEYKVETDYHLYHSKYNMYKLFLCIVGRMLIHPYYCGYTVCDCLIATKSGDFAEQE